MTWELREGDCLDPVTGLASLPDGSVDHVITDPPYEAEAHTLQRRTTRGSHSEAMRVARPDALPFDPIRPDDRLATAGQFSRVARRWIVVFCQAEAVWLWREALADAGASYKRACIWVKPDGMPQLTGDRPGMGYESIVCAHAPGKSRWNGGGRCGVYTFGKQPDGRLVQQLHPTMKPIGLMEALVRDFTDPGELVLDPFAGSGTTGVAAIHLGRNFVGWERDARYAEIARRRLSAAREQLVLAPRGARAKQGGLF